MAAGRKKAGANRNPVFQVQEDAARSEQKKSNQDRSMSASDKRIMAFVRAKEAQEEQQLKEDRKRKRNEARARAGSRAVPPSKVTVRKVEPSPNGHRSSLKQVPENHEVKPPKWTTMGSSRKVSKPSDSKPEFIPRNLRDAVKGSDGKLRTTSDHKGRNWRP